MLQDARITELILSSYFDDLVECFRCEAIVVGAGPTGLTAARWLAQEGLRVVVLERNLFTGGEMWGGGGMATRIVVQEKAKPLLSEAGVKLASKGKGYYVADAIEAVAALTLGAVRAGARVFTGLVAEDLVVRNNRVEGVVVQWNPVVRAGLHVDPLSLEAKAVLDATGHGAELVRKLVEKTRVQLSTLTGGLLGEGPMWAEEGERLVVEKTG